MKGQQLREAHRFLSSLKVGDPVIVTQDGKEVRVTVQRSLARPGNIGSWEHSAVVTVGFGPGRWNIEVSSARLAEGYVVLSRERRITGMEDEKASA